MYTSPSSPVTISSTFLIGLLPSGNVFPGRSW
jgi:hypothetical protein